MNINLPENISIRSDVPPVAPSEEVVETPTEVVTPTVDERPFSAAEKIPSAWHITPNGDEGDIQAMHQSGRLFVGTIADFNKKLHG